MSSHSVLSLQHHFFPTLSSADFGRCSAYLGICIFTEGDPLKNESDPITLGEAKALVDRMIYPTGCKYCGRIPIHYLDRNVTDATNNGGILKVDYRTNDVCIDKCVGPWSFKGTATPTPTSTTDKDTPAVRPPPGSCSPPPAAANNAAAAANANTAGAADAVRIALEQGEVLAAPCWVLVEGESPVAHMILARRLEVQDLDRILHSTGRVVPYLNEQLLCPQCQSAR